MAAGFVGKAGIIGGMTTPSVATAPVGDPWPEEDPNVLAAMLRVAEREYREAAASRRVQRARAFCPGMALNGEMLAPKLDLAAQAMRRGDLADSQLDAIRTVITRLPAHVDFQQRREAEAAIVEGAKHMDAGRLYRLGTRLHAYLDPDGAAPSEKEDAKPRRELHCTPVATAASRCAAFSTPRPAVCCRTCSRHWPNQRVRTVSPILDQLPSVTVTRLPTS